MKTTLVELAYKLMENNKADKLQIIYNGTTIAYMSPKEVYWGLSRLFIIKRVEYLWDWECKADSTPIMKNDPTYLCVITIKDGELDK